MSRRFFVDPPIQNDRAVLTGQEARHLSKVMRAKVGDEFTLFDGSGDEFLARIETVSKSEVGFTIIERKFVDRELAIRLVVGVALPKGDRQRWLVEKLVELGVTELVPLITDRSVAQPSGNAIARLRRAVVEASKQCGRNRLMMIGSACTLEKFLIDSQDVAMRMIAHPPISGEAGHPWNIASEDVTVAIGPEGGFTEGELALAEQNDWQNISLGSRILRTETAAVVISGVIGLG